MGATGRRSRNSRRRSDGVDRRRKSNWLPVLRGHAIQDLAQRKSALQRDARGGQRRPRPTGARAACGFAGRRRARRRSRRCARPAAAAEWPAPTRGATRGRPPARCGFRRRARRAAGPLSAAARLRPPRGRRPPTGRGRTQQTKRGRGERQRPASRRPKIERPDIGKIREIGTTRAIRSTGTAVSLRPPPSPGNSSPRAARGPRPQELCFRGDSCRKTRAICDAASCNLLLGRCARLPAVSSSAVVCCKRPRRQVPACWK